MPHFKKEFIDDLDYKSILEKYFDFAVDNQFSPNCRILAIFEVTIYKYFDEFREIYY